MLRLIAMTTVLGFLIMECQPMGGEHCSSIDHLARAPGQSTSPPQRDAPQHASAASGIGSSGGERVPELMARIDVLGHDVPLAQKREASRALIAAGKAAVPVLIG